jgi:hypothetical protein
MSFGMMIQKELIELIQQHHPDMGETECRKALNRAQSQFGSETEIIEDLFTDTIVAEQRYYKLADSNADSMHPIITIKRVDIEGEVIPRLTSTPPTIDSDEVAS